MMALTFSYFEYLARELQAAFKGMSTKEKVVLDIILTRNNAEMHLLQDTYSKSESQGRRDPGQQDVRRACHAFQVCICRSDD